MKTVIAICGSTKKTSTNLGLIKAIAAAYEHDIIVSIYGGITDLPYFNPDMDLDIPPPAVIDFREQLRQADGILICTPEYAMGVPGVLKNAIDWTVSSCDFAHKPTALITASSLGQKAHASLMETLKIIEAGLTDETQLLISYAQTKISKEAQIIDGTTRQEVDLLMKAFLSMMK